MANPDSVENYNAEMKKKLDAFKFAKEWSDFISLLSSLDKTLYRYNFQHVPHVKLLCKRLTQCLNPALPSGVHSKSLQTYSFIFKKLSTDSLIENFKILTFGFFSSALSIKTVCYEQYLNLIETFVLPIIESIKDSIPNIILGILPFLESETIETYDKARIIMHTLCNIDNFYSAIWNCFYVHTDLRMSVINFMLSCKMVEGAVSEDLVIQALCAGMGDKQITVVRGSLDILIKLYPAKKIEQKSALKVSRSILKLMLKKEVSLKKRIKAWFDVENKKEIVCEALSSYVNDEGIYTFYRIVCVLIEDEELLRYVLDRLIIPALKCVYFGTHETRTIAFTSISSEYESKSIYRGMKTFHSLVEPHMFWSIIYLNFMRCDNMNEIAKLLIILFSDETDVSEIHVMNFLYLFFYRFDSIDPSLCYLFLKNNIYVVKKCSGVNIEAIDEFYSCEGSFKSIEKQKVEDEITELSNLKCTGNDLLVEDGKLNMENSKEGNSNLVNNRDGNDDFKSNMTKSMDEMNVNENIEFDGMVSKGVFIKDGKLIKHKNVDEENDKEIATDVIYNGSTVNNYGNLDVENSKTLRGTETDTKLLKKIKDSIFEIIAKSLKKCPFEIYCLILDLVCEKNEVFKSESFLTEFYGVFYNSKTENQITALSAISKLNLLYFNVEYFTKVTLLNNLEYGDEIKNEQTTKLLFKFESLLNGRIEATLNDYLGCCDDFYVSSEEGRKQNADTIKKICILIERAVNSRNCEKYEFMSLFTNFVSKVHLNPNFMSDLLFLVDQIYYFEYVFEFILSNLSFNSIILLEFFIENSVEFCDFFRGFVKRRALFYGLLNFIKEENQNVEEEINIIPKEKHLNNVKNHNSVADENNVVLNDNQVALDLLTISTDRNVDLGRGETLGNTKKTEILNEMNTILRNNEKEINYTLNSKIIETLSLIIANDLYVDREFDVTKVIMLLDTNRRIRCALPIILSQLERQEVVNFLLEKMKLLELRNEILSLIMHSSDYNLQFEYYKEILECCYCVRIYSRIIEHVINSNFSENTANYVINVVIEKVGVKAQSIENKKTKQRISKIKLNKNIQTILMDSNTVYDLNINEDNSNLATVEYIKFTDKILRICNAKKQLILINALLKNHACILKYYFDKDNIYKTILINSGLNIYGYLICLNAYYDKDELKELIPKINPVLINIYIQNKYLCVKEHYNYFLDLMNRVTVFSPLHIEIIENAANFINKNILFHGYAESIEQLTLLKSVFLKLNLQSTVVLTKTVFSLIFSILDFDNVDLYVPALDFLLNLTLVPDNSKYWSITFYDYFLKSTFFNRKNSIEIDLITKIATNFTKQNSGYIYELINKLEESFFLSKETEILTKNAAMVRLAFLILVGDVNQFMPNLPKLFEIIAHYFSLVNFYKKSLFLLLRVIILKFKHSKLSNLWPLLFNEILVLLETDSDFLPILKFLDLLFVLNRKETIEYQTMFFIKKRNLDEKICIELKNSEFIIECKLLELSTSLMLNGARRISLDLSENTVYERLSAGLNVKIEDIKLNIPDKRRILCTNGDISYIKAYLEVAPVYYAYIDMYSQGVDEKNIEEFMMADFFNPGS